MATDEEVKQIIQHAIDFRSETDNVEFKDARGGFPRDTWQAVSAFSHRPEGGYIVFGVQEDRDNKKIHIVGVTEIALLQERMGQLAAESMNVVIRPSYNLLSFGEHQILAAYIPPCSEHLKPCYNKSTGLPNGAYVRDGNTNRRITDQEMKQFHNNARLPKYDSLRAEGVEMRDISVEGKIRHLLEVTSKKTGRAVPRVIEFDLLKNLGVADIFDDEQFPTIAGFLLFAKGFPQDKKEFSRYLIRCVRYQGSSVSTAIIDKLDIGGTLDEQIDIMQAFILRNIRVSAQIVGTKRVERYEYPEAALRELVANAVIHRDYSITETYTQVNIFEDRIEIFNPGCLPPGVTVETIRSAQVSRNPTIAARLKDLDYLEEYGRGIDIVYAEMEKWGLLPPIFKNAVNSFKVILPGVKLSSINDRQFKIWEQILERGTVSAGECAGLLPEVSRATVNSDLIAMQEAGLIHAQGKGSQTKYVANF